MSPIPHSRPRRPSRLARGLSADALLDQRTRLLGPQRRPAGVALLDRPRRADRPHRRLPVRHQRVRNRAIFDAIEKREATTVFHLTAVFFPLAIGSIVLGVAQVFARMGIQRRWRAWLTASVLTRWLRQRALLSAQSGRRRPQEPGIPHRRGSARRDRFPVDFLAGVTSALLSAVTFIIVLWTIGGALTVTLGGIDHHHPRLPRHRRDPLRRDRLRFDPR